MAHPKKKKCSKKPLAAVPHKESLGEMWRLYRATVAWLRHLSTALRHAFARVRLISVSARAYKASDSAPRLAPSPATLPSPTGAKNRASTLPPPTGTKDCTSGSQGSCSKSSDSAPRPATKPTTSSPPTVAENSVTQASGSDPAPDSKGSGSALRLAPKPATPLPPTGATYSTAGSQASGSTPAAGAKSIYAAPVPGPKKSWNSVGLNQNEPFSDGYHLNSLFEEDECFVVDEYVLIYARFCSKRAASLLNKRKICHICYFEHGKVSTFKKDELEKHCSSMHKNGVFLCEKKGCFMRTSSVGDAGRHHYFCHEKHNDWWVQYLKLHGEV